LRLPILELLRGELEHSRARRLSFPRPESQARQCPFEKGENGGARGTFKSAVGA
jgi:hypothetical protein